MNLDIPTERYMLWPDGTHCEVHEAHFYLHMSDDFEIVDAVEVDGELIVDRSRADVHGRWMIV